MDRDHLAEQDQKAQADLRDADSRFRTWLRKYATVVGQGNADYGFTAEEVPDLVNLSSSAQIQTLLFGGFQSSKDVLKTPTKPEAEAGMKPHNIKPQLATVRSLTLLVAWRCAQCTLVPTSRLAYVAGSPIHRRESEVWGGRRKEAAIVPADLCVWSARDQDQERLHHHADVSSGATDDVICGVARHVWQTWCCQEAAEGGGWGQRARRKRRSC